MVYRDAFDRVGSDRGSGWEFARECRGELVPIRPRRFCG